jgi:hypothetical protein
MRFVPLRKVSYPIGSGASASPRLPEINFAPIILSFQVGQPIYVLLVTFLLARSIFLLTGYNS